MSKGRRYDSERKLNVKKVIATILVFIVIVLVIVAMVVIPKKNKEKGSGKNVANSYIVEYVEGKWGVINSKGETIIEPSYSDMIVIPDETKEVFIVTENVDLDAETYSSKAIDEKSEQLFTDYDKVEAIQTIDEDGVIDTASAVLKVSKDDKYGLININGKELLACDYDDIQATDGNSNCYVVSKDKKYGLVDNGGNIIIECKYNEVDQLTDRYEDGFVVKNDKGKYGLIDINKIQILDCKYDEIKNVTGSDLYVVKESGKLKVITSVGEDILTSGFDEVLSIENTMLVVKNGKKYSVITSDGKTKIKDYDYIEYAFDDYYIAEKDNKYGVIDVDGNTKVDFKYTNIVYRSDAGFIEAEKDDGTSDLLDTSFVTKVTGIVSSVNIEEGYIKIRVDSEYEYYNLKLEKKDVTEILVSNTLFLSKENGKYGFVNKDGQVIVDYIYDDATEQNEYGYAAIKKDGKWGAIDSTGKVVLEPTLSLVNNPVVSFIGTLHLAPDLNANYYTDLDE